MFHRVSLVLLLLCGTALGQDMAGAKKALDQAHLPRVTSTAPTDGQVLTWDSTLGKAKWAAGGGGGGSFDPAAATNITFASSNGTITGAANQNLVLTIPDATGSNDGKELYIYAGSGGGSGGSGGYGGYVNIFGGNGGSNSGGVSIQAGSVADGQTGDLVFVIPSAAGENNSAGNMRFTLGNSTGSGTPSSFQLFDADGNRLHEIGYDGTVTGPQGSTFNIEATTPSDGSGNRLTLRASNGVGTNKDGGDFYAYAGNATGSGDFAGGGSFFAYAGSGGASATAGTINLQTGNGGSTSGASGGMTFTIGSTTDGNTGAWSVVIPSATGTNRTAGPATIRLGAKTGSGTDGYFAIQNASSANLFKVGYDGKITGPTGAAFEITGAASQSLYLTAPNQILFNSAGDYMRMGNAFLNLSSAGGLYFCSESTATTAEASFYRAGTRSYSLSSDIAGDDTDRETQFNVMSCTGPNLICGLLANSNHGTVTLTSYYGGAYGGSSTMALVAGGVTTTFNSSGLTTSKFTVGSGGPTIQSGSGSPESSVTAGVGSVYCRTGALSSLWIKSTGSGNTGWLALGASTVVTKSADYSVTPTDTYILASGNTIITLENANVGAGRIVHVKKTDASNTITVKSTAGTLDGVAAGTGVTLTTQYSAYTFVSDGTNWHIF